MKKDDSPPSGIDTLGILIMAIVIFTVIAIIFTMLTLAASTTETKIIKVKYTAVGTLSITDDCGHPMNYSPEYINEKINLSDVYEVDIKTDKFRQMITRIELVEKEKYVDSCNIT